MKKQVFGLFYALFTLSIITISWAPAQAKKTNVSLNTPISAHELLEKYVDEIYESAHLQESGLAFNIFKKALTGFINLKLADKLPQTSSILTVIDFNKSSREKRMWIIDVISKELILNTWVAHGQGSGDDIASEFSDKEDSHKSSLGFYVTDNVYYGKHGRSLKLDGMDPGFNANARSREIVVHGAGYVSQGAIEHLGYLGRSFGCPAVSPEVADQVIDAIKDKTVIFIDGYSSHYSSKYLDEEQAANFVANSNIPYIANL